MKILLMTFLIASGVYAADSGKASYVPHDKVATALKQSGPLVKASDLSVSGSHRDKAGLVEVHDKETDVFYVTDGSATLVTGGTMIDGKDVKPGQHVGSSIQGGETHHLTKGDVVVIPAGMPHWFKEVPQSISYYVVKVLKE